jgi:hypothetical protein
VQELDVPSGALEPDSVSDESKGGGDDTSVALAASVEAALPPSSIPAEPLSALLPCVDVDDLELQDTGAAIAMSTAAITRLFMARSILGSLRVPICSCRGKLDHTRSEWAR